MSWLGAHIEMLGALMCVLSFVLFAYDKISAVYGRHRLPEFYLLLPSACLGALGGLFGMILFNHKTRKPLFYIGVPLLLALQILLLWYIWWPMK